MHTQKELDFRSAMQIYLKAHNTDNSYNVRVHSLDPLCAWPGNPDYIYFLRNGKIPTRPQMDYSEFWY